LCIRNYHGGELQDEDGIIENLIQNPSPSVSTLGEIVKETKNNPSTDLYLVDPTSLHVKNIEFSLQRTLKINTSLSASQ